MGGSSGRLPDIRLATKDRAVEVLTLPADPGQHRAPSVPDLIIAATAELDGLTALPLEYFDVIAEVHSSARRVPERPLTS